MGRQQQGPQNGRQLNDPTGFRPRVEVRLADRELRGHRHGHQPSQIVGHQQRGAQRCRQVYL